MTVFVSESICVCFCVRGTLELTWLLLKGNKDGPGDNLFSYCLREILQVLYVHHLGHRSLQNDDVNILSQYQSQILHIFFSLTNTTLTHVHKEINR